MAEENRPEPWKGSDGNQSWQPSHIGNETADSQTGANGPTGSAGQHESVGPNGTGKVGQSPEWSQSTGQTEPISRPRSDTSDRATAPMDPVQATGDEAPAGSIDNAPGTLDASSPDPAATSAPSSEASTDQHVQQPAQTYYRPAPLYGAYAPAGQSAPKPSAPQQGQPGQQPASGPWDQSGTPGAFGQPVTGNAPAGNRPGTPYPAFGRPAANGSPAQGQGPFPPNGGRTPNGSMAGGSLSGTGKYVFTAVVAALVAAALMLGLGWAALSNGWVSLPSSSNLTGVSSNTSGQGTAKIQGGKAPDWQAISKDASASVVSIQVKVKNGVGAGSGAVIDNQGHVVTNNHVVDGAQEINVTLSNGQIYTAKVVGTDTTADLAVIALNNAPNDLKPIQYADSDKLAVGEDVMAIGNPLGYENTATTGIVSALNRPVSVMDESNNNPVVTNAIQLDAAINPGNSGGPTFNVAGQVVGINSSIASMASSQSEAGSIGIGFAIPSNLVKRISEEIIKNGKAKHVSLGVTITSSTVQADGVTRGGAKVNKVVSGSSAEKAGIKSGDTIVAFNGNAVNNNYSLLGYVRAAAYGSSAKITVVRDNKAVDVNVTLDQEEQAVQGKPKSNRRSSGNDGSNQDDSGNGNGNGSGNGNGNSQDPFGFFFGQ